MQDSAFKGAGWCRAALIGAVALLLCMPAPAMAGKVILRIRAGNPIDKPQTVKIKSNLPAGIRTNDILNLAGLDLGYDVKSDVYYVHKDVELSPRQIAVYDIEIADVWAIPPEDLKHIGEQAAKLVTTLDGTDLQAGAQALREEINRNLDMIASNQAVAAVGPNVKVIQHIRAYEANLELLKRVRKDIGRIENLVIASGKDPGELIGEIDAPAKPKREIILTTNDMRVAIIRITVRNTSPKEARKIPVRRDMPREIAIGDVLDGGGLDIGTDARTGLIYVYRDEVEVPPNEAKTFEVKVRDKWNINVKRMEMLSTMATQLVSRIGGNAAYASVEKLLNELAAELGAMVTTPGPKDLNDKYVAYYRDQRRRLDEIEQKLNRIDSILQPIPKRPQYGTNLKPPSLKTTWMIIYIILGFLAVMSLLFFVRWFGKSKSESIEGQGPENKG